MRDRYGEGITVVPHRPEWEHQFRAVADALAIILAPLQVAAIEHVGSTSVRGLPAKPVLDIDVIVHRATMTPATSALERAGYVHCGDLGMTDREASRHRTSSRHATSTSAWPARCMSGITSLSGMPYGHALTCGSGTGR